MIDLAHLYRVMLDEDQERYTRGCAAIVLASVLLFMGALFLGLVLWASK